MKQKYTIEVEDGDDANAILRAVKSDSAYLALFQFDSWIRSEIKHKDKDYEEVREALHDAMQNYGVSLDDLP